MRFTRDPKRKERTAVGRFFLQPYNVIKVHKMFCVSVCNISYQIILLSSKRKVENPPRRFSRCLARWLPAWALRLLIFFRGSSFISQREREREGSQGEEKPSTQCPLMENGKATQREMKAEAVG
jgi:hypothetical protein